MSNSPRETLLSLVSCSLTSIFTRDVIIVASLVTWAILITRYALPTHMTIDLDKCLLEVEDLYYNTRETHGFNLPEAENDLAGRLLKYAVITTIGYLHSLHCGQHSIQDEAASLRIRTLRLTHAPRMAWWSEYRGFFVGHSLAIWRCISNIRALRRDLQLKQQQKMQALHAEFAAGNSPPWQLRMRQRYCGSHNDSHAFGGPMKRAV
ncbi:hypothetical protein B0H10DRAFT_1955717 [Mycena sp. CBHHK59/15]|nr:hypothetical protein B0H10DRAFT_1955717 [Mycena sp. CBHHK59/15]